METGDSLALSSCISDAIGLLHVLRSLSSHPRAPLLLQGLLAPASMYVVESQRCVAALSPQALDSLLAPDVEFLRLSRHRAKLLDYHPIGHVSKQLVQVAAEQRSQFNSPHRGPLRFVKRALQGDLGLSLCDGHVFWTTHGTIYAFGSQDVTGTNAGAFGMTFGQYLSGLLSVFGISVDDVPGETPSFGSIEMRDIKYEALYRRGPLGSAGVDVGAAASLTLSAVNFSRLVLQRTLPEDNATRFRFLFLTAFHSAAGLQAIQDGLLAKRQDSESAMGVLRECLGHPDARWLRRQSPLRNVLVHYTQDPGVEPACPGDVSRKEAIARLAGLPFEDVRALVERYLDHLSETLEAGFQLTDKDPFWYAKIT